MRYKLIKSGDTVLLLQDDGYRIYYKFIESKAENVDWAEWNLWADYKQCDFPRVSEIIADTLMTDAVKI